MLDQDGFGHRAGRRSAPIITAAYQLLGHPALDIIGEATARATQQASDVALRVTLARLHDGLIEPAENAGTLAGGTGRKLRKRAAMGEVGV
jgi:hypothetical protein